jgi:hypothetical protein
MPTVVDGMLSQCFRDAIALEDCPPHHTELAKVLLAMSKKEVYTQYLFLNANFERDFLARMLGWSSSVPLTCRALILQIASRKMLPAL